MKRRDLFKAAPAVALFALPAVAAAKSPVEDIMHHVTELRRLLMETMPCAGEVNYLMAFQADGSFMTTGPLNSGLTFRSDKGGWVSDKRI